MGKQPKKRLARVFLKGGESFNSKAHKEGGHWLIGGDYPSKNAVTYIAAKAGRFEDGGKWAWHVLKGSRLVFVDYMEEEEVELNRRIMEGEL